MERLRCCSRRAETEGREYRTADLESLEERRTRWRSIRIIYLTMFVMSTGFTIILTGVWPYLAKLDPLAGKEFLGLVTAANPLAETIFSPLLGYWSNRSGTVRTPMLATLALLALASTGYSLLEVFPASTAKYWMLLTRFLIGVSAANVTLIRSYLSAATTLSERTGAMSMLALFQVLGYIFGPIVQALLTTLGEEGFALVGQVVYLNMYTAVGWVIVVLSLLCFVLMLPFSFTERHIAAREARTRHALSLSLQVESNTTWTVGKPDYLAAFSLIVAYFVLVFNISLLENLGIPIVMDQFAWTNSQALYYMGILMAFGAILSVTVIALLKFICRFFSEASVILYGGFLFMLLGRLFYIPWGSAPPLLKMQDGFGNMTSDVGCPVAEQTWCADTPAMTIPQLLIGYLFTSVGYPIGVTVIFSLFSKILGPRPQGVWMGVMMGCGSLARAIGTVVLSVMYVELGTSKTFWITSAMMLLYGGWLLLVRHRLQPPAPLDAPKLPPKSKPIVLGEGNWEERQTLKQPE